MGRRLLRTMLRYVSFIAFVLFCFYPDLSVSAVNIRMSVSIAIGVGNFQCCSGSHDLARQIGVERQDNRPRNCTTM